MNSFEFDDRPVEVTSQFDRQTIAALNAWDDYATLIVCCAGNQHASVFRRSFWPNGQAFFSKMDSKVQRIPVCTNAPEDVRILCNRFRRNEIRIDGVGETE